MNIGFTGTQTGMTDKQIDAVARILNMLKPRANEFHHGDCIGADAMAVKIATKLEYRIVCHPPDRAIKRAYCDSDETKETKPYLHRNKDIVNESDVMIATPGESREVVRSGTWSTIRFSRKTETPLFVVFPDGSISDEASHVLL